ncbi:hypothetical protein OSB04_010381 [Centaurea solstitialis]|uniref:PB1 domain-containing protein n=1 Tax=Centaurea solstitialis TaxID=347529 RepID=A0AA38WCS4_9ASTR|nr:hypothetical protein OSB04_010381 [Centaurea solstitialis]
MATSYSPVDVLSRLLKASPTFIQRKITTILNSLEIETTRFLQFWAPVKINGRWLLTTSDQPFAISEIIDAGQKYRSCSVRYRYSIDDDMVEAEVEEDPTIIVDGAPARAFLNRTPELLPDLRIHRTTALESIAVRCGLFRSVMVPVFDPSGTCCVGVVECCSDHPYPIITMYDDLIEAFKKEGLKTFCATPPYETVSGLQHAHDVILKALDIIWQELHIGLVQVWIAYKDEEHVAFSSSLEDSPTQRMLGLKLAHYIGDEDLYDNGYAYQSFSDHCCICQDIPLKMGEGLVGRTLANRKPRFMRKLSKLSDNNEPLVILGHNYFDAEGGDPFECSCFVICLRSTETADFSYVFEFLWQEVPDYVNLMESILLYLKRNRIIIGIGGIRKRSSVGGESLRPLKAKCKKTPISLSQEGMIEAAKNLYVPLKRKRNDISDTNEEDKGPSEDPLANNREMDLDENIVTIKLECADDMIKFTLPISSATFAAIVKKIGKRFKLDPANYKLKYHDEDGDWILLACDEDMKGQIDLTKEDTTIITNGAPARAFLNRMPELLPDLRVHRTTPLESIAVRCGLYRSVMVPVFDPSGTCCVGVVECSTKSCLELVLMLDFLRKRFQSICGLQHAPDKIKKALEIIWQNFRLDLVQVWIAYKDEKHVAFSSSLDDSPTKRTLGLKLVDQYIDNESYVNYDGYECFVDYSSICCDIPLKMGEGLVGRTLKNHKPRFMKKVSKLSDNQPLLMVRHVGFLVDLGPNWYESRFEKQTVNSNIKPIWFDQRKHNCVKNPKAHDLLLFI